MLGYVTKNHYFCPEKPTGISVRKFFSFIIASITILFLCIFMKQSNAISSPIGGMDDGYKLVFEDQFNSSRLDTAKWEIPPRGKSTWSRWISDREEVVTLKRGRLTCKAIPNHKHSQDTATMLTGAVWTKGKFSLKYGRIEVRMRTNLQKGNFPAAWMGREWGKGNIPPYGEIDIVEMVGDEKVARHAFHTEFTTKTPKHGIKNSFTKPIDVTKWHIYGVEWTPDYIHWYIDGEITARHEKPKGNADTVQKEWTFDVPFYILLNQSIIHGAYSIKADLNQTYETQFDWIKIYQKQ